MTRAAMPRAHPGQRRGFGDIAPRRKRSSAIDLSGLCTSRLSKAASATVVAASLGGCSSPGDFQKNEYTSAANCAADYSFSQCATGAYGPTYRMLGGRNVVCRGYYAGAGRYFERSMSFSGHPGLARIVKIERGLFGPRCRSSSGG